MSAILAVSPFVVSLTIAFLYPICMYRDYYSYIDAMIIFSCFIVVMLFIAMWIDCTNINPQMIKYLWFVSIISSFMIIIDLINFTKDINAKENLN